MLRTIFFGTDTYAAALLSSLVQNKDMSVALVVTMPDRPVGRNAVMTKSPVKEMAESLGIEIYDPKSLRNSEKDFSVFDIGICTRYGNIITKEILEGVRLGVLNIHPSILPAYRGATPIQSALIDGCTTTGVTIMKMNEGLDTGPILDIKTLAVTTEDTYETISQKTSAIAVQELPRIIRDYAAGALQPQEQPEAGVSYCKEFTKDDGRIDWTNKTAIQIFNQWQGMAHWPGLWTLCEGRRVKILNVLPTDGSLSAGSVVFEDNRIFVGTKEGRLEILELQREGKKALQAKEFIAGEQHTDTLQFV